MGITLKKNTKEKIKFFLSKKVLFKKIQKILIILVCKKAKNIKKLNRILQFYFKNLYK